MTVTVQVALCEQFRKKVTSVTVTVYTVVTVGELTLVVAVLVLPRKVDGVQV